MAGAVLQSTYNLILEAKSLLTQVEYTLVKASNETEVKEKIEPENLIKIPLSWYSILEAIKKGVESRAMKEFWLDIDKKKLNQNPEKIGQDIIDSFLHFGESIFNTNNTNFRFSKEDEVWARGRIDFIFRFTNPYQEIPVEIKVVQKESELNNYGENQLLDYMKKRNFKQGIRLILNATQNHDTSSFEKNNITHFFINIWQPTSSSLNKQGLYFKKLSPNPNYATPTPHHHQKPPRPG